MTRLVAVGLLAAALGPAARAEAQSRWEIVDNSFLVEEAFNQEPGVFQNIFTWARERDGGWGANFTQEWPVAGVTHQLSYTIPFSSNAGETHLDDVMLNYRYQLLTETARRPAVSPRVSAILSTGREEDHIAEGAGGVQVNVPASKQFGDLYVHANVGFTWRSGVGQTPLAAAGGIWRVTPMFHAMFESVALFGDSLTVSPGFRRGWNIGRHQLVFGLAVPVTSGTDRDDVALLTYVSYELPFR